MSANSAVIRENLKNHKEVSEPDPVNIKFNKINKIIGISNKRIKGKTMINVWEEKNGNVALIGISKKDKNNYKSNKRGTCIYNVYLKDGEENYSVSILYRSR